jgi:hypothetical protein
MPKADEYGIQWPNTCAQSVSCSRCYEISSSDFLCASSTPRPRLVLSVDVFSDMQADLDTWRTAMIPFSSRHFRANSSKGSYTNFPACSLARESGGMASRSCRVFCGTSSMRSHYILYKASTHIRQDLSHLYFRVFVMCTLLPLNTATRRREPFVHMAHFGLGRKLTLSSYASHSLQAGPHEMSDLVRSYGRILSLLFWSIL